VPFSPVLVSVCVTCRTPVIDDADHPGRKLLRALRAQPLPEGVKVGAVRCLGVCRRPATAAVSAAGGFSFVFGDLEAESGGVALASFATSYQKSEFGLVPWRERAEPLRKGMISRVPPLGWTGPPGDPAE
jgi:predicted metal-binding protein